MAAGLQEFGGGAKTGNSWGTPQPTHFNAFAALLKKELDKLDKEGCISSKGSCGEGEGPVGRRMAVHSAF